MGINVILSSIKHKTIEYEKENNMQNSFRYKKSFKEGLFSNVLNPKPAIFFMSFLPQFINPTDSVFFKSMFLASIQFDFGIVWLIFLFVFLFKIKHYLINEKSRKILDRLSGGVLIAFCVKLGTESN